ncbi:hypothetical protein [Agrococcus sp. KRD186]|uniref:hypothetical protein n=1 Tax=Agrococcus sp. KRD186 TaxID=2729730 RepID=UPI0019CFEB5C|nr:hypothetical protein [Agrococcus sp. KRD186]
MLAFRDQEFNFPNALWFGDIDPFRSANGASRGVVECDPQTEGANDLLAPVVNLDVVSGVIVKEAENLIAVGVLSLRGFDAYRVEQIDVRDTFAFR